MASIQFRNVVKSFGRTQVIRGVDLDIEDGEFCVFVGPSGCGKSTMLRLIAGLEDITSGELLIDGERMNERAPSRRGVAIVFQSYALYPHMNAYQNMAFGLKLASKGKGKGKGKDKPGKQEIDRRVREAARILQIEDLLDRLPKQMSGGQRQRVAIGRAITRQPRVFLFDEPLSNLDAGLRVRTRIEIARLHTRLGTTMVYVTHDQVEAMTLADKIVILDKGRIAQVGTPLELYHKPQNLFVAGFIGSPRMNFLAVEGSSGGDPAGDSADDSTIGASGSRVTLRGGRQVAVPIAEVGEGDAILGIRPEHVTRVTGSDPSAPGEEDGAGVLEGEVQLIEHLGDGSLIYVSTEYSDDPLAIKEDGDVALAPGETIRFRFPRVSCHVFAGALGDGEPAIEQKALSRLVERSHPDARE